MMVPKAALPIHSMESRNTAIKSSGKKMDDPRQTTSPTPPTEQETHTRRPSRPDNTRSSTDPSPSLLLQGYFKEKDLSRPSSSHRNRSPYSRSHLRSRSSGAVAGLPLMTRAHSMPSPPTSRSFSGGESTTPPTVSGTLSPAAVPTIGGPRSTPPRTRSPFKPSTAEEGKGWMDGGPGIESIQEDSELDFHQPKVFGAQSPLVQPTALHAARVPSIGGRRRPASPLYNQQTSASSPPAVAGAAGPTSFPATVMDTPTTIHHTSSSSASSSPSLGPQNHQQKYINEAYPTSLPPPTHQLHHHSSHSSITSLSSYPSTPTSARSRSPSISSLDTIEDEPEREAIESLKAVEEEGEDGERRRSSLDGPRPAVGFGFGRGRSERKRWSVCGGERRGDLDLETIWED